ncbi:SusD-like starch-binding protein associating with outer membrane [Chitinophaga skermanii]|uniref:SusD-like starch-binding protein associating with outer membrane n=1 Tax=Chitinophaga skermanii TaxID=331697 RepID=A0A327R4M2_9BACT|nr:RagB/SusD family nutrient uptake outer membrane protein [Chitinophaga skermanii]RAJ10714.1 SusD-like starch-binding protein associating with outer membrane [Chitinophaga skermanii]
MKRIFSFFLIMISYLVLSSCSKDWLDQKPDGSMSTPSTLTDFEALLDENRTYLSPLGIGEIASDDHFTSETIWAAGITNQERNAYTWSKDYPNIEIADWNSSYSGVLKCNVVIDGIEKVILRNASDAIRKNSILGNALFHRARLYFELSQIYAPLYVSSQRNSLDMGVPLRLDPDISVSSSRAINSEVYDQIIKDLETATKLLPEYGEYKIRASKVSAFALLAIINLSIGEYEKASIYCDSVFNAKFRLINFNDVVAGIKNLGRFNDEVILHTTGARYPLLSIGCNIDTFLYSTYKKGDLRKSVYFDSTITRIIYKGAYSNSRNIPFYGIALDEVYLVKSEALCRLNKTKNAVEVLNSLLVQRFELNKYIPYDLNLSSTELLPIILLERRKELILRGRRWLDLKRFNNDPAIAKTLLRNIGGSQYLLQPKSFKYVFPIPDDVISKSGIKQNNGW